MDESGKAGFLALGGILGALAASSCCLVPLLLFSVGVSGAWISSLTALAPYQPLFLAFTGLALAFGFRQVYRRRGCAEGHCERPLPRPVVKLGLWLAVILVIAAVALPYAAPFLL